jgi:cell division protein FtsB
LGNFLGAGRCLLVALAIVALTLQGQLWFSSAGFSKTQNLRVAVEEQSGQNDVLSMRNLALEAEVINLKQSSEAAEERARTDLGMIGPKETFYQVVPASSSTH